MQKKLYLLPALFLFAYAVNAADDDNRKIVPRLVALMKEENETISPNDGPGFKGYVKIFCNDPCAFFRASEEQSQERIACQVMGLESSMEDLILGYVMRQKLTINQKNIFSLGAPLALQMREQFEQDQREAIRHHLSER